MGWTVPESNAGGGGEIFRTRPDRPWGPSSLLYNGYRVSFPGVMRSTRGVHQPPRSSADVKEAAEFPFCALMACSSVYLTFYRMSLCTSPLAHGMSSICIWRQFILSLRNECKQSDPSVRLSCRPRSWPLFVYSYSLRALSLTFVNTTTSATQNAGDRVPFQPSFVVVINARFP